MKLPAHFAMAALLALPLGGIVGTAIAADTAHGHHGHEVHGSMELNQGQKWEIDDALFQGMNELHQIVSIALEGIEENSLKADDYTNMSGELTTQFTYIMENCNLEPEPDIQLHILLANIIQNIEVIEGKVDGEQPEDGVLAMAKTLNSYGEHFNHPNWKSFDVVH